MARTILYVLFFAIFYYFLKLFVKTFFGPGRKNKTDPGTEELVQDPCCRTYISKRLAITKRVSGREVHFCGKECLRSYLKARQTPGA